VEVVEQAALPEVVKVMEVAQVEVATG